MQVKAQLMQAPSSSHRLDVDGGDEWAFVVVFPNKDPAHIKKLLVRLQKAGLELKLFYSKTTTADGVPTMVFCKVRAKLKALEAEAARINLPMLMDETKLAALAKRGIQHDDGSWSSFEIGDAITLARDRLTPYEYIYMKYDVKYDEVRDLYAKTPAGGVFSSVQRMELIESMITNVAHFDVDKLKADGEILDCFPLHSVDELRALQRKWVAWNYMPWSQPIHEVKNYFGTKVALYFAYLGYYTSFLFVSGVVGLGVFSLDMGLRQRYNATASDAGANYVVQVYTVPAFGVFMAVWATLFLEGWKRRSAVYAMHWGTTHHSEAEQPRPQFKGDLAKSPINGADIKFFNETERLKRRVLSWLVLFGLIGVVLVLTGLIFYLRYYLVHLNPDIFVVHVHGRDVRLGGAFASTINLLQIFIMYRIYDGLSLRMNDFENHATESSYEANYILKAIIFHFVNAYAALIYVASVKEHVGDQCIDGDCFNELRYSLIVIYGSQIVIGNIKEILVPRFWAWLAKHKQQAGNVMALSPAERQFFKSHYGWKGTFDDFLEMILQFGYSTFFVVSFPLTPLLSFINNVIEIRIDGYRLTADCRRPRPRSAANIGLWIEVLEVFVTIAIVTNAWVIFYTHKYANELIEYLEQHDMDVPLLDLGLFVGFVTVVLLFRALVAACIDDVPAYVARQLARQAFLTSKVLHRVKPDDDEAYTVADDRIAASMKIAPIDDDP
ncbi:hypothetical protein SPRG_03316 [Saprolegnia parasitica CBS 223.65]|uniref:Anoctamin dimerisation domain-containing protein n=1 Tax=Saprolegnia parasitica (strain CBS 223.65) TaxID=695850 RepID=A0A067CZ71_SAPPC|nr:hypothetical protein SPRG_03316 [Saprolegnia parasitica CBS 223.65]KDO32097.1 hypothetical protein SPRG_03316 [Saprolegnia parasitica CBS 223.65]|eukprot:XP_012197283.1 hypothetical protein SPRG_03316 [Saprolegnia parasitica CBS 223.65]